MESIQHIKSRLGAVKNIGTITRAMEVVSATKMRRSQMLALDSRAYAFAALSTLSDLLRYAPEVHLEKSQFVKQREVKATLLVLIASDRGLASSFNANVMREADKYLAARPLSEYSLVLVGKKLGAWATRNKLPVEMMFTDFGDHAHMQEVAPLSDFILKGFIEKKWDKVVVISAHFRTTLDQTTLTREILPMHVDQIMDTVREIVPEHGRFSEYREKHEDRSMRIENNNFIFEPSPESVLDTLLPHLLNMQLFHLVLEANASEHSARMVAMKNASENAGELSDTLSLEFNKARQALITKEMIEITSAIV